MPKFSEMPIRERSAIEVCDYCYHERVGYTMHKKAGRDDTTWETPAICLMLSCICSPEQRCMSPMCEYSNRSGAKTK